MGEKPEFDKKHFDKLPEIVRHRLHMFREHAVCQDKDKDKIEFFNCYGAMILADNIQKNNLRGIYRNGKLNRNTIDLFRKKNGLENHSVDMYFVNEMAAKIVKAQNAKGEDARLAAYTDVLSYRAAYDKDEDLNNNPREKTEHMPLYASIYIGEGKLVMNEDGKKVRYGGKSVVQMKIDFGNNEKGVPYVGEKEVSRKINVSRHKNPQFYTNDRNTKSPYD